MQRYANENKIPTFYYFPDCYFLTNERSVVIGHKISRLDFDLHWPTAVRKYFVHKVDVLGSICDATINCVHIYREKISTVSTNHIFMIGTVKSRAVDQSTIQF